jgi:hypothetical protein
MGERHANARGQLTALFQFPVPQLQKDVVWKATGTHLWLFCVESNVFRRPSMAGFEGFLAIGQGRNATTQIADCPLPCCHALLAQGMPTKPDNLFQRWCASRWNGDALSSSVGSPFGDRR